MIGLVVLDFGGPQGPDELEPFLSSLLEDVLPGPLAIKKLIAPSLAKYRAKKVAPDYALIGWSPLVPTHEAQVAKLKEKLGDKLPAVVVSGMMFTEPSMDSAAQQLISAGVTKIIAIPMFPHYSIATTNAAFQFFYEALVQNDGAHIPVHYVPAFYDHPMYLDALAQTIEEGVANTPGPEDEPVHLLFTPHGLPVSFVQRGDPYPDHIRASMRAVLKQMNWQGPAHLGWQSRVGPVQWLIPSTPMMLDHIAAEGGKRVCLIPISFASEHIETLHEIDIEYREYAEEAGIHHFGRAPALGERAPFINCLADLVESALEDMSAYKCVRCLLPKPESHRRRGQCVNCKFTLPTFLKDGAHL